MRKLLLLVSLIYIFCTNYSYCQTGCGQPVLKFNGANHPTEAATPFPGLHHYKLTLEKGPECPFNGRYEIASVKLYLIRGVDFVSQMEFSGSSLSVPFSGKAIPGDRIVFQPIGCKAIYPSGKKEPVKVAPVTWHIKSAFF